MTETYPFVFVGHGPLDPDFVGKCSEVCLWFQEPVTAAQLRKFHKTCPEALSWFICAADQFIYFGSHGDVYDADVTMEYCSDETKALLADFESDFDDTKWDAYEDAINVEFGDILDRFAKDLERWAIAVHEEAPIAFFAGPNGGSSDWHEWSTTQIADVAYPLMTAYEERGPNLELIDPDIVGVEEGATPEDIIQHVTEKVTWCRSIVEFYAS